MFLSRVIGLPVVVVVVLCDCFLSDWFGFAVLEASQKCLIPDGVVCGFDLLHFRHKRSCSHSDPACLFPNTSLSRALSPLTSHLGGIRVLRCILGLWGECRTQH